MSQFCLAATMFLSPVHPLPKSQPARPPVSRSTKQERPALIRLNSPLIFLEYDSINRQALAFAAIVDVNRGVDFDPGADGVFVQVPCRS